MRKISEDVKEVNQKSEAMFKVCVAFVFWKTPRIRWVRVRVHLTGLPRIERRALRPHRLRLKEKPFASLESFCYAYIAQSVLCVLSDSIMFYPRKSCNINDGGFDICARWNDRALPLSSSWALPLGLLCWVLLDFHLSSSLRALGSLKTWSHCLWIWSRYIYIDEKACPPRHEATWIKRMFVQRGYSWSNPLATCIMTNLFLKSEPALTCFSLACFWHVWQKKERKELKTGSRKALPSLLHTCFFSKLYISWNIILYVFFLFCCCKYLYMIFTRDVAHMMTCSSRTCGLCRRVRLARRCEVSSCHPFCVPWLTWDDTGFVESRVRKPTLVNTTLCSDSMGSNSRQTSWKKPRASFLPKPEGTAPMFAVFLRGPLGKVWQSRLKTVETFQWILLIVGTLYQRASLVTRTLCLWWRSKLSFREAGRCARLRSQWTEHARRWTINLAELLTWQTGSREGRWRGGFAIEWKLQEEEE